MPITVRTPKPPRGWRAIPWRLPIWLYRLGLGGLLGSRFLLLEHIGRKTGKRRQNVLEVIGYDPAGPTYYVASGFGRRAHWFRNLQAHPQVHIQVGWRRYPARAEILPPEHGARILQAYAQAHPWAFRELGRLLHMPPITTPEGFRALAQAVPVVALHCTAA